MLRRRLGALAVVLVILSLIATASRTPAVTGDEMRCLKAIEQTAGRATGKLMKIRSKCEGAKATGRLGATVDCLADPAPLGPGTNSFRTDNRLRKVLLDYRGKIEQRCISVQPFDIGVQN